MPFTSRDRRNGALWEAVTASTDIRDWTEGKMLSDYTGDTLLRSAIERQFGVFTRSIRIAAQQDESLRDDMPRLSEVIGLGEALADRYDETDHEAIWSAITVDFPMIRARIVDVLGEEDDSSFACV